VLSWIVLDISERFEYEQDLQTKNDQLAKVNNQMERFLYSASHDLRSPLTSILGLVNLLRLETKEKAILEYVNKIENCTFKLDNIIKDLMSFSKSNYQRIKSEKIDFETTIWKVINSHRTVADFKKILFEVKLMGEVPFYCDQERVEIILDHLIRNSIIFYDANKVKPIVRINGNISAQEIILEIIDNGIGISGHHLSNVFSMFYKASDRSKGAGLGLYIVKENVQQLKGTIQVESEIGFGSVLRIIIPNDAKGRLINRKLQLQAGLPSFSM
jgi:signal transduction histidine kinase